MNSRLLVLCFGNFIIGTGTLIVPGMLPALAHGLGVNVPVAVTAIQAAAQFTVLSFLVPSFKTLFNASPETISILLVAFGATGVAGNIIGARMVDRIGAAKVTLLGLIPMLTSHVLWLFVPGSWLLLVAFLLLWGRLLLDQQRAAGAAGHALSIACTGIGGNEFVGNVFRTSRGYGGWRCRTRRRRRAVCLYRTGADQRPAVRRFHRRILARRPQENPRSLKEERARPRSWSCFPL